MEQRQPVYKKDDRLNCSNYRAITVRNAAYKILSQILFCRLTPLARNFVGSYQAEFVGGKSPTDQIFILLQILQKYQERKILTYHLFIDFKAAYDTIPTNRNKQWNIMQRYHFPGKLIRLLEAFMNGAVQGKSIELDVGGNVTDSPICSSTSPWKVSFEARG